jgi:hypothetical protein
MKASKQVSLFAVAALIVAMGAAYSCQMHAQVEVAKSAKASNISSGPQWSVQVDKVDPGNVNLAPSFRIAIYESLIDELSKTKQFSRVIRDGAHDASNISGLLILKTTVEKYTAGSETKRAVTTVGGATKLTVRSRLCTRDGQTISERTVDGNVRFMGSNLKATHNLARNVVKTIKQSSLPAPPQNGSEQSGEGSVGSRSAIR